MMHIIKWFPIVGFALALMDKRTRSDLTHGAESDAVMLFDIYHIFCIAAVMAAMISSTLK